LACHESWSSLSFSVQQLNQIVDKIGTSEDNERNRTATSELIHKSNELTHTTSRMLKDLGAQANANIDVNLRLIIKKSANFAILAPNASPE
jgi:hypothetical protein